MRVAGAAPAWPGVLARIDWTQPWHAPFAGAGMRVAADMLAGADLRQALNASLGGHDAHGMPQRIVTGGGQRARFVAQHTLPAGVAYESHIFATGCIPTRDNLHDVFNALVWLRFPRTKAALNRLQAEAIGRDGVAGARGALRDAATLFDENAVLFLVSAPGPEEALRAFDWKSLFVDGRAAWGRACMVLPFGHALLEKLVSPYKSITAHAWPLAIGADTMAGIADAASVAQIDILLAASVLQRDLHARRFAPLPVMGIPGWCDQNGEPAFYDDISVFRPGRRERGTVQRC